MHWTLIFIPAVVGLLAGYMAWNSGRFCLTCNRKLPPDRGSEVCAFCNALESFEVAMNENKDNAVEIPDWFQVPIRLKPKPAHGGYPEPARKPQPVVEDCPEAKEFLQNHELWQYIPDRLGGVVAALMQDYADKAA